jgi:hypothetical protein
MKKMARNVIDAVVANDAIWSGAAGLGLSRIRRLAYARAMVVRSRIIEAMGLPCRVAVGPFAGMVFPDLIDRGGGWMPRLLGTYEAEIAWAVEQAIEAQPDLVIDIGCAEGYYAVGLAKRMPHTHVDAYDIVETERNLCQNMARANFVADRVAVKSLCTVQSLLDTDPSQRCLIVCDCEGAERELITPEVGRHHRRSWFIIECHDHVHDGIGRTLADTLSGTHEWRLVSSTSDAEKALQNHVSDLADGECQSVREFIYGEGRPCAMNWLVAIPRA